MSRFFKSKPKMILLLAGCIVLCTIVSIWLAKTVLNRSWKDFFTPPTGNLEESAEDIEKHEAI